MGILDGVRQWFSANLDTEKAGRRAGIDYLSKQGMMGERLDLLKKANDPTSDTWAGDFNRGVIPYMNIGKDMGNKKAVRAFLRFRKRYLETVEINDAIQKREGARNEKIAKLEAYYLKVLNMYAPIIAGYSFNDANEVRNLVMDTKTSFVDKKGNPAEGEEHASQQ